MAVNGQSTAVMSGRNAEFIRVKHNLSGRNIIYQGEIQFMRSKCNFFKSKDDLSGRNTHHASAKHNLSGRNTINDARTKRTFYQGKTHIIRVNTIYHARTKHNLSGRNKIYQVETQFIRAKQFIMPGRKTVYWGET